MQEESGQREIRVFKVSGASHDLAFTEVFRQNLQSHGSQLHRPFIMAIGPSSVIVMWTVTDRERQYVIMGLESSWKEPLIQSLEDTREISAIPLSIAIARSPAPSPRFSGTFDFALFSPSLLRDSVHTSGDSTDASPHGIIGSCGNTRVVLVGIHQKNLFELKSRPISVIQVLIPSDDAPSDTQISVYSTVAVPEVLEREMHESNFEHVLYGAKRLLRASRERYRRHERLRLRCLEIRITDEEGRDSTGQVGGSKDDGHKPDRDANEGRHRRRRRRRDDIEKEMVSRPGPGIVLRESPTLLVGSDGTGLAWSSSEVACVDLERGRVCLVENFGEGQRRGGHVGKELVVVDFA
ncbi:hypothetical protein CONPUDRAFT_168343 [Coniophora puteana RWD-64-598 SS2]|uniref:Uncharacterized protein n=1 Tax=Coniophora puteana (strain RWD-64-598) TaxID=741705 RepID=A0A5M3ME41_CONPW|nr:uncharacterized protein CONPUDRAFT_168343 [Coniophora puteana RWD-64-598 SS2]EIW77413.1 hypothetical protein CONPUDRAFT_168343 [Coniophora puteana RWD-64-598 SS2]